MQSTMSCLYSTNLGWGKMKRNFITLTASSFHGWFRIFWACCPSRSGRVSLGSGIWPKFWAGFGKMQKFLTGYGNWLRLGKRDSPTVLHGKEDGIRGRDYKRSWKRSRNAGSQNPLPDPGPWEYYLDSQPFIETKQQSENPQTVHE